MSTEGIRIVRAVMVLAALGTLVISGISTKPWVRAADAYDNGAIADRALSYYSGNNSQRAPGAKACTDARKPGDSGGQCRAFVNCIIWMVSGGKQNAGGGYFQGFINAGGDEIRNGGDLRKGDIVQEGNGRHTSIIVSRVRDNRYMVVDSNHWGDATVGYYERGMSLGGDVRAFRMGTLPVTNAPPIGNIDEAVAVPEGIRVAGWALDTDTPASIATHVYSGSGEPGRNPGVTTVANLHRPDVDWVFRRGAARGFDVVVPATYSTRQRVCAYGINVPTAANPPTACKDMYRAVDVPFGHLDLVERVADGVRVAGWAIDPETAAPIEAHVYGGSGGAGGPLWSVRADTNRPDVGSVYPGYGPTHGFDTVLPVGPDPQWVCGYAINDRLGHNPWIGCSRI